MQLKPAFVDAIFGAAGVPGGQGLSNFASVISGIQLDKTEQVGNWANRPLRLEQKRYAALDAYALVRVYYDVVERIQNAGLMETHAADLDELEVCSRIGVTTARQKRVAPYTQSMKKGEEEDIYELVKVSAVCSNSRRAGFRGLPCIGPGAQPCV